MPEKSTISIVIPFLNEAENIPELVQQLEGLQKAHLELGLELVFVDDGSTDNSIQVLNDCMSKNDLIWRLVKLSRNYGSYNALRVGVFYSRSDIVSFLYADLQDPVSLVPQMYEKIKAGNDIVVAARKSTQYKFSDRFFSVLHARMVRRFIAPSYPEMGFDVVMFNKAIKERLNENIEADSNIFLQILKSGFKQEFIQYDKVERKQGESKWSFAAKIKASVDVLVGFSYLPVRFISIMGIILLLASAIWLTAFLILWSSGVRLSIMWSLMVVVLLICFGITNISLGILGEYLWRILNAARKRPAFTVDEVIDQVK